jgi:serine/threonine-protein kinase
MGSPYYMAPEQMMSSKDVDARADVWALGIILYELLTGKPPFFAETMAEVVYMVTQRDPAPLRDKRPDVPEGLADAISRCLSRDTAQRYPQGMRGTSATWAKSQPGAGSPAKARVVVVGIAVGVVAVIGAGVVWRVTQGSQASKGQDTPVAAASPAPSAALSALAGQALPPPSATAAVLAPLPEATADVPGLAKSSAVARPAAPAGPGKPAPMQAAAQAPPKSKASPLVAAQPAAPPPAPPPPASRGGGLNMGMKD